MSAPIVPIAAAEHLQRLHQSLLEAAKDLDRARLACGDCEAGRYLEFVGASLVAMGSDVDRLVVLGIRQLNDRRSNPR